MEIKISNLKLKNFKGIKDLEINFNCQNTNIYGANATGKTTVFDAFEWLIFDKDSNDKKDFSIKTLDSNNKYIHFLEHEVQATIMVDNKEMTLRKQYKEKWVKRRGQEKQEFAGHDTNYWIDEVPLAKKQYEDKIENEIAEIIKLKMVIDPLYFSTKMSWQERKKWLINVSGLNITDENILKREERFKIILDNLEGRTIEDYKKVLQSGVKKLEDEIKEIPIKIDTLNGQLTTQNNINYEDLEKEKEICKEELQKVELQMADVKARAEENMKKADKLAIAKNELNNLKFKLEVEQNKGYSEEIIKLQNEKTLLENSIRNKKYEYEDRNNKIESDQKQKEELYRKWDEANNLKLEIDPNKFICPTCKREYEAEKVEEMQKEFETNFNNEKERKKQAINKEGQALNVRIEENTIAKSELEKQIQEAESKLKSINEGIDKIKDEQSKADKLDVTCMPEYQEKMKEVENLQKEVDSIMNDDLSDLQNKKEKINNQVIDIDKKLVRKEIDEKIKSDIEKYKNEETEKACRVQELEQQLYLIEEFGRLKIEIFEDTINSNFALVKFKLIQEQINGGMKEDCVATLNGVPFNDLNNAGRITAGLDIINTISRFYNMKAPIFIDNRESINEIYNIDTQIISLIVTTDKELRIEVM